MFTRTLYVFMIIFCFGASAIAQETADESLKMDEALLKEFKWRNIGPAFVSGRIADIAIHPEDDNVWYVAVGSGGVWKTQNAGTTFEPIFDKYASYSTGCITIDPSNPHTIWLGTGENVGGRHVAFGDGIYKSEDDGASWSNMGLKNSEHISKIIVHPDNSQVIMVAVQGPLWSKGRERGFYKSIDGGLTWKKTLGDEEWTGVTDIVIDPRDPQVLYAATWQRHRTVAALMGGGPKSNIYKSTDGGETWTELKKGLPMGNRGKIGLAISPQQPDVLYAAIELDRKKGGVYRSSNMGASWIKMSDAVSGATGPHYYQELYASPHQFDKLYLMDVRIQVSDDGGKTFYRMSEQEKHSDNHSIAFKMDDPDYLLVGTDAGIYETYDGTKTWRMFDNMPITQYYKVAVDDAEPFYHVFGGTQDNGSHGGPSQTDNSSGIRNADWYKTLGADGHQSATEPGNPDIVYGEFQQGVLFRIDRITGETILIQPQPRAGEPEERYNWDAPIVVSTHKPSRLYFASYRVWRSENRGDSWSPISGDLTKSEERLALPIMGRVQSWDSPWDVGAMSNYNTITSLAESPVQEGLLYAGTDDGSIHVTEDGGNAWRKIEISKLPGVPATAFVNNLYADMHDASTVYVALDNHKYGDFKPYLLKSMDKGSTWKSFTNGLPERTLVWRIVQDHVKSSLMFLATEFGIYTTFDGGNNWIKMTSGLPTIAFRDITIQRRENDVVAASFGRSFYVLDDYSPLREISAEGLQKEGHIYDIKTADLFVPRNVIQGVGHDKYRADNPAFGAVISYHIGADYPSIKTERIKKEKDLNKNNKDIPFPGWDALETEKIEEGVQIYLQITDLSGNIISVLNASSSKGLHRVAWNLRHSSQNPIQLSERSQGNWDGRGHLVTPGSYNVALLKVHQGVITPLTEPRKFEVKRLYDRPALPPKSTEVIVKYQSDLDELRNAVGALNYTFQNSQNKLNALERALKVSRKQSPSLVKQIFDANQETEQLNLRMNGYSTKEEIGERNAPNLNDRMGVASRGNGTYGPTEMHLQSLKIARDEYKEIKPLVDRLANNVIPAIEKAAAALGVPYIYGQALPDIED